MYLTDPDKFENFYKQKPDGWNLRHWKSNIGDWEKGSGRAKSKFHREHYGHQSEIGFKDVANMWKAEKLDADK